MPQKNTNNDKNKCSVILIVICVTFFSLCYAGLYWWVFQETVAEGRPAFIMLVLTAVPVLIIIGVIAVARQRMQEIDKGELDEAKKY